MLTVLKKILIHGVRLALRAYTLLRHPGLLSDPTQLVCQLWPGVPERNPDPAAQTKVPRLSRLHIIIPYRDNWHLTHMTLKSLTEQTWEHVHACISLVDNGSAPITRKNVADWLAINSHHAHLRFVQHELDIPFNFSKLNNLAFKKVEPDFQSDFLLFLNNDVVLEDKQTVIRLLQAAEAIGPRFGAISCTLLYPNQRVQHSFLAPGVVIVGAHPLKGIRFDRRFRWFQSTHKVPAVTGALFLMRTQVFKSLGKFDEKLATCYQDVDLCLKALTAGLENYTIADLTAVHHESASRKSLPPLSEAEYIYKKWGPSLVENPQVPTQLSRWSEYPVLSLGEPMFPWWWLFSKK